MTKKDFTYQDNLIKEERFNSMVLDHMIHSFVLGIIFTLPVVAMGFPFKAHEEAEVAMVLWFGFYLNKDFLGGRSISKRLLGQVIIDNKTKKSASELQCMIRNFMMILWIIEVPISIFSPNRRLGDFMARTRVVRTEKVKVNTMLQDFKNLNIFRFILALGISILYSWAMFEIKDIIFPPISSPPFPSQP